MKFRSAIAYCIFAVYSLTLVHTVIPHDHHVHDYLNKVVAVFNQADDHHHDGSDHHHAQEQKHDDHQLPHHEESQHPDNYTLSSSSTSNLIAQLALSMVYCNTPQTFDLTPIVTDIDQQDIYYIPLKIPIQFSSAVPLRAPPVV